MRGDGNFPGSLGLGPGSGNSGTFPGKWIHRAYGDFPGRPSRPRSGIWLSDPNTSLEGTFCLPRLRRCATRAVLVHALALQAVNARPSAVYGYVS